VNVRQKCKALWWPLDL